MDFLESTKVVFQRIEKIEPENVFKIMGCLLLKDHGELEMIRLAFSPERVLQNLIETIKLELESTPKPTISAHVPALPPVKKSLVSKVLKPFTPASSLPPLVSAARLPLNGLWIPVMPKAQQLTPMVWHDSAAVAYSLQYQFGSYNMDASSYPMQAYYPLCPPSGPQPSLQLSDFARPVCGSFMQGYCKYGGSCCFLHIFQLQNGDYMVVNPPTTLDEILSNGSLKLLELELIELLKSRRGIPVSVSSLPILYFDHYEKVLHIEGYLMDNHRQRFVCQMIQLLARMTSSIWLTNRPHGRQSMILAEDYDKYAELGEERNENELQVYLTFPSESSFADQEVYNYFYNFGPVQGIRIPSQMRRMFGFVTFVFPETAALVLSKTNPHYICGEQVLVKPYQLRRTLFERSNMGKVQHQISNDKDIPELPNDLEDHEQPVELETKRSSETEAVSVSQASNESSF